MTNEIAWYEIYPTKQKELNQRVTRHDPETQPNNALTNPLSHPSIRPQILTIDPRRIRTSQKANNLRDLLWGPNPVHWIPGGDHLDYVLWLSVVEEVGSGGAGGNTVDCDAATTEVFREDAGHLFDCAFGGDVEEVVGGYSGSGSEGG